MAGHVDGKANGLMGSQLYFIHRMRIVMQNRQKDGSWNDAQIPTMAGNTEPSFAQDNPRPACTRTR